MTRRPAILALLLAASISAHPTTGLAVYGGSPVPGAEGGAAVFFQWSARGTTGSCSGVLFDERAVLTAAHCVRSAEYGQHRVRSVRVGNPEATVDRRRVLSTTVHPEFQVAHPELGNDLAVLVLQRAITNRPAARLATGADDPTRQGERVRILGFGITRARARTASSRVLRSITLEYLSPFQCFSGQVARMAATRLCAASPAAGVCPGDSGSPMLRTIDGREVVVGITSLAINERVCSDTAAVATRVAPFRAWILSVIEGRAPENEPAGAPP